MLRFLIPRYILLLVFLCFFHVNANAQSNIKGPHVLVVIAHPDDESVLSVTLYKITKEHHGIIDLFVITDGEAGYKYATLAENYYGVALTNEKTGRNELPRIRKQELKNAGNILGVAHYYFMDQRDSHYGLNEHDPLDTSWNVKAVNKKLDQLLTDNLFFFLLAINRIFHYHNLA